ncbi:MAG: GNAT family N-acetyltransferase [Nocardioides sp.]
MSTEVSDQPEQSRYEIRVDGELAGFAEYELHGDHTTFTHTEVDDAYEGQGLGSKLARAVLDGARDAGLAVHPECAFIARYVKRHPHDYLDLVPEDARAKYGL